MKIKNLKYNKHLDLYREGVGALFLLAHLYTVIIAFLETDHPIYGLLTFIFPFISEIYWIVKLYGENNFFVYTVLIAIILFPLSNYLITFEKIIDKYQTLIDLILKRSFTYQLREINDNTIEIRDKLIKFKISEKKDKLFIDWEWTTVVGRKHHLNWVFENHELDNQVSIYNKIDNDMDVQSLIDEGWPKEPALDYMRIKNCKDEKKKEILSNQFNKKYPNFFEEMVKEIEKKQKKKF